MLGIFRPTAHPRMNPTKCGYIVAFGFGVFERCYRRTGLVHLANLRMGCGKFAPHMNWWIAPTLECFDCILIPVRHVEDVY